VRRRGVSRTVRCRVDVDVPGIRTIAIVTKGRAATLERCLASHVRSLAASGRSVSFLVMDDSDTAQERNACRRVLAQYVRREGVDIRYAGAEEKWAYLAKLASASRVPEDVIRFAILGMPELTRRVGANRNAVLLDTWGELILSLDDDTTARAAPSPSFQPGVIFSRLYNGWETWFFESREEAWAAVALRDANVLSMHERLLGRPLHQCGLDDPGVGTVAATLMGLTGDAGIEYPQWLTSIGSTRDRLCESAEVYQRSMRSRAVCRVPPTYVVTPNPFLMTYAVGLDNREILPPFCPVQRNQDGIFALSLRRCRANAYFGHVPWAIVHDPPEARTWDADALVRSVSGCRSDLILLNCIGAFVQQPSLEPAGNLRLLGEHLSTLAAMAPEAFEEFLRARVSPLVAGAVQQLEGEKRPARLWPPFLVADFERYVRGLRDAFSRDSFFAPVDLVEDVGEERARDAMRAVLRQFGALFEHWPDLLAGAAALEQEGTRLSRSVCAA
jgi:hypothetical protein